MKTMESRRGGARLTTTAVLRIVSLLVAALLLAPADAHAAKTPQQVAQDAAHARQMRQQQLQRRKDAEARLQQFVANPPATAPMWLQREAEKRKAGLSAPTTRRMP